MTPSVAGSTLLIDTNLLVLLVVGRVNPQRIKRFKRTSAYDERSYELLASIIRQARRLLTVPHVWAEVSNLTDLEGPELVSARETLKELIDVVTEQATPSRDAASDSAYGHFGLTDAAITLTAEQYGCAVLTDDFALYGSLCQRGIAALNFNHFRGREWAT